MYWDIIVAAVVTIALGFLWYGPLFGKPWMKLMGITPKQMKEGKKKGMPASTYILMILTSLITAYVLKLVLLQFPFRSSLSLVIAAAILWLGFMVPLIMDGVLWESKSWKLFFINAGYRLVSIVAMTIVYLSF